MLPDRVESTDLGRRRSLKGERVNTLAFVMIEPSMPGPCSGAKISCIMASLVRVD
jgi:hypothetical protein